MNPDSRAVEVMTTLGVLGGEHRDGIVFEALRRRRSAP